MKYTIVNGELHRTNELRHHGVKGMRWGVRKDRRSYGEIRSEVYGDKANKERAKGEVADRIKLRAYNSASSLMRRRAGLGLGVEIEYDSVAKKRIRIAEKTSKLLKKINNNNETQINKKLGDLKAKSKKTQEYEKWIDTHMNQINDSFNTMSIASATGAFVGRRLGGSVAGAASSLISGLAGHMVGGAMGKRKDADPAEQRRMAKELAARDAKEQKRKKKPIK